MQMRLWLRHIARRPWLFGAAILSLAIGIGGLTAVHAVIDHTLLRPMSGVPAVDDLVAVRQGETPGDSAEYRYTQFLAMQARTDLFDRVAAFGLLLPAQPLRVAGHDVAGSSVLVTDNYFEVLGVQPVAGRLFTSADQRPHAAPTVVLSHAFWRRHLDGTTTAIGRTIAVGDVQATVIGVAAMGFRGTDLAVEPDVYLPLWQMSHVNPVEFEWFGDRSPMWLQMVARLAPGVSMRQANAALATPTQQPSPLGPGAFLDGARLIPLDTAAVPPRFWETVQSFISLFALAAIALLLVTALTVGTLLLVRGEERRREIAVRVALGATRRRLILEAWGEALGLTLIGGALAMPTAYALLAGLVAWTRSAADLDIRVPISAGVLAASLATAVVVSVVITAVSCRVNVGPSVTEALRGTSPPSGLQRRSLRGLLVVAQVATAMALLVSTLLLVRSLRALSTVDLHYDPAGLVEATVDLTAARTTEDDRRQLYETLEQDLRRTLPGSSLGQTSRESFASLSMLQQPQAAVDARAPTRRGPAVLLRAVTPGYLQSIGMKVVAGRVFTPEDARTGATPTVIVSRRLARMLHAQAEVIGLRLGPGAGLGEPIVIGVVDDVVDDPRYRAMATAYVLTGTLPAFVATAAEPEVSTRVPKRTTFVIRSSNRTGIADLVNTRLLRWRGGTMQVRTTAERLADAAAPQRVAATAIGALGAIAVSLAMISIFVLISSTIVARTRELATRIALGATTRDIGGLLLRDTGVTFVAGLGLGSVVAFGGTDVMRTLLFGVAQVDVVSYVGAGAGLLLVAIGVATGPVRRASKLNPCRILQDW